MAELKDLTNHESVLDQIKQYHNLISLDADQLQELKAINQAQQKLYEALTALELD